MMEATISHQPSSYPNIHLIYTKATERSPMEHSPSHFSTVSLLHSQADIHIFPSSHPATLFACMLAVIRLCDNFCLYLVSVNQKSTRGEKAPRTMWYFYAFSITANQTENHEHCQHYYKTIQYKYQILANNDILNALALSTNDLNCPDFERIFSIINSICHSFALSIFYAQPIKKCGKKWDTQTLISLT